MCSLRENIHEIVTVHSVYSNESIEQLRGDSEYGD